jgi:glycosyltransferase involved in cell wall biosynthesis
MLRFKERPDVIFVYQLSPVTVAIPAILLKYRIKAKLVLYIQDLWPQSVVAANGSSSRLVFKILEKLTNWIYRSSDKILIQSRAFKDYIKSNVVTEDKIKYLPNSTEKYYQKIEKTEKYSAYFHDGINIVFAGNIGEAQSFDTIIDAAKIVAQQTTLVRWVIVGDGRKRADVEKRIKDENLEGFFVFAGSYPPEEMPYFFAHADALLVSLKKDFIFSLTIPSKIQSYLACEKTYNWLFRWRR